MIDIAGVFLLLVFVTFGFGLWVNYILEDKIRRLEKKLMGKSEGKK